jgi:NAD(P)-dependent dehydrogenase (short-subunit alcohol dehydrogenase family)
MKSSMSPSLSHALNPTFLVKNAALFNFKGFSLADTLSLAGKVAVVTGGQAGIGQEIVLQLLLHDIDKVYILARSGEKYELAKAIWVERGRLTKESVEKRTEFVRCDLSDMVAVKKVGDLLLSKLERLDILLDNAGECVLDTHESPQWK